MSGDGQIHQSRKSDPDFCLEFSVSHKPIILLGVGLFLPHGENIMGNLRLMGIKNNYITKSMDANICDRVSYVWICLVEYQYRNRTHFRK